MLWNDHWNEYHINRYEMISKSHHYNIVSQTTCPSHSPPLEHGYESTWMAIHFSRFSLCPAIITSALLCSTIEVGGGSFVKIGALMIWKVVLSASPTAAGWNVCTKTPKANMVKVINYTSQTCTIIHLNSIQCCRPYPHRFHYRPPPTPLAFAIIRIPIALYFFIPAFA